MNRLEGGTRTNYLDNPRSWKNRYAPNCEPYDLYLETLYFVLMTASTVGFGDMVPDTIAEYILTILLMNFGTTTYSLICGSIINAIRDETTKAYRFSTMQVGETGEKKFHQAPDRRARDSGGPQGEAAQEHRNRDRLGRSQLGKGVPKKAADTAAQSAIPPPPP